MSLTWGSPETVNCTNGEVDLIDGHWTLQPHRRELYRTTQIPVKYEPAASAPKFVVFLEQIFRDDETKARK